MKASMKTLTVTHLQRHPEKLCQFETVRIWSGQWSSWWRPNGCGYTTSRDDAGIYSIDDAWQRVSHVGREKKLSLEEVKPA